ncbi:MAG: VOC family protein [Bacteroidota bacterium]
MKNLYQTFRPEGFGNLNIYLMMDDPQAFIDFVQNVFAAEEISRTEDEEGVIRNSILKIGDTCMMVAQVQKGFSHMSMAFYLYVNDTDSLYQKALDAGCEALFEPMDMDYGDRQGGVKDPFGNYWWISKRLVEEAY